MKVVLVSPYEIGRQPFGLAQPAAWLAEEGFDVRCVDLAVQRLDPDALAGAGLVGLYVAMHTATRLAVEVLPRIRRAAPGAHLCAFGLYAPMNATRLRTLGVDTVLGGEVEASLLALAERVRAGAAVADRHAAEPPVSLARLPFRVPDRSGLPPLSAYARLELPDGTERVVGFAEASRGCRHVCRHCPVVPVYQGRFRVVPREVVLADVRNQVAAGAGHVSFGDPDFLNGPTHARKLVRAMHAEFPALTWDAVVKIEHLVAHAEVLPELAANGCLFLTSAVESVDDAVLERLDKGHTDADFARAVTLTRDAGIALAPTFVPFTPWTTVAGYVRLLERLIELRVVEAVPPVQLAIRLLVPAGSWLLRLPGFEAMLEPFDPERLGHPWHHPEPAVDALQERVQALAEAADAAGEPRRETFARIREAAWAALGEPPPPLPADVGAPVPRLSEAWYCCAEPTERQLAAI